MTEEEEDSLYIIDIFTYNVVYTRETELDVWTVILNDKFTQFKQSLIMDYEISQITWN